MKISKFKKSVAILTAFILIISLCSTSYAAYVGSSYISSSGACVMDFESGNIIYEHNGNVKRPPASMTKIMTVYCVYEALNDGIITLTTVVPISNRVNRFSANPEFQSTVLYTNTVYTVDEMLDMVLVYSDAACALALAELVGNGFESEFVKIMNQKSSELELGTTFYDSYGGSSNLISPISIAKLLRAFIAKYPQVLERSSKRSVYFHGRSYYSTNRLYSSQYYPGADGFKTGTTTAAGFCFTATAERNSHRVIAVTMASSSTSQRFTDAAKLLDYGFTYTRNLYDTIYYTDTSISVNGSQIPSFAHRGTSVLIAENLRYYGFDVIYDNQSRTLRLKYNPQNEVSPMDVSSFKGLEGKKAFDIYGSDISVIIETENGELVLPKAYNINGMTCICVDDLHGIFSVMWNPELRAIDIYTY